MAEEHSVKNLVSRTASDPWSALLGRRPNSYQIPEVGQTLMGTIDFAVFERRIEKAIVTGVIFEKWAQKDIHFACKAPAVMSTIYCICNHIEIAEEKIMKAKSKLRHCTDCEAHYLKRYAYFLMNDERLRESIESYSQAILLFQQLGDTLEQAKCFMNRGLVKGIMHDFEAGLYDEEAAMEILDVSSGHYLIIGSINRAYMLTRLGRKQEAREKVDESQGLLAGIPNVERPKLILRWIKSLLLEDTGKDKDRKLAGQMLDRVEGRMKHLSMQQEIRVLLADRARMARAPHTIQQIARKARDMEYSRRVRACIQAVIDHPTRDNILKWRNALDCYVPPFVESA